jgi:maleylacetoacetate isomerase
MTESGSIKLYDYWRSSCAYRVRIALECKGIPYEKISIDLRSGQQSSPEYLALNPQGLVPLFCHNDIQISQSLAIIQYLEDTFPKRPKLIQFDDPVKKARILQISYAIACDIHPIQNLRILKKVGDERKAAWAKEIINDGFIGTFLWLSGVKTK